MEKIKTIIKEKSWRLLLITVCLNVALIGIYLYLYTQIQQKNQHIAELAANIDDLTVQKDSLKSAKENISQTAILQKEIDSYFVPKDGVVKFLNLIQALGNENRLISAVTSVVIGEVSVDPDVFETLNVGFEFYGTWADAYHFAALVELMPYKISVGKMKLEKLPADMKKVAVGNQAQVDISGRPWKGILSLSILKFK